MESKKDNKLKNNKRTRNNSRNKKIGKREFFSIKEDKCKKEGYSSCKEKEEECVNDGFKDCAEREEEMKCIEEGYNSCEEKNNSIEHLVIMKWIVHVNVKKLK